MENTEAGVRFTAILSRMADKDMLKAENRLIALLWQSSIIKGGGDRLWPMRIKKILMLC